MAKLGRKEEISLQKKLLQKNSAIAKGENGFRLVSKQVWITVLSKQKLTKTDQKARLFY